MINLFIVTLSGLFLRLLQFISAPKINYSNILHAHSHFAFSGWIFLALFIAFIHSFLPKNAGKVKKSYQIQFWLMQIAAFGMLLSFPLQGYAAISISFSTLFILVSYWFSWQFFKDTRLEKQTISLRFAKAALFFLILSSIGPFSFGPIMANGGRGSALYFNALYFYLHFQYNGWFTFGVLALFFRWLENNSYIFAQKQVRQFFHWMFWACILTFALSLLWTKPPIWIYLIGAIGGLLQCVAFFRFIKVLKSIKRNILSNLSKAVRFLLLLSFIAFSLKLFMQAISSIPLIAEWVYMVKHLIIGYLHLVLLGFISLFLFAFLIQNRFLVIQTPWARLGLSVFIIGVILTEVIIFGEGIANLLNTGIPEFKLCLLTFSILLPLGIGLLLPSQFSLTTKTKVSKVFKSF